MKRENRHVRTVRVLTVLMIMVMMITTGCAGGGSEETPVQKNEAAGLIGDLTSEVTADNAAEYDFTGKAMEYLEYIGRSLKNRRFDGGGTDNVHEETQEWIRSELKSAGYEDTQIIEQRFKVSMDENGESDETIGCNIILTIEGKDPSRQIIAGAHYDGDGLGDNGSGTALLLATAAGLSGIQPQYTLKLVFFDGEEDGCFGSEYCAYEMSEDEVDKTIYMINLDALAFGDYCNVYGGSYGDAGVPTDPSQLRAPEATEAYDFAADTAEMLGFKAWRTEDLNGYFAEHGSGPEIEEGTIYTNPWTPENPAPANNSNMSPSTIPASDHANFMDRGIEYIYFEATNWFAEGSDDDAEAISYTGYVDTQDYDRGEHGMFMNTEYDTWENLNDYYPGRAEKHFRIYSPLLSALLLVK